MAAGSSSSCRPSGVRAWQYRYRLDGKEQVATRQAFAVVAADWVEKFYSRALVLAGKHSPHSWRSVLSTWANEAGKDTGAVEAQLDRSPLVTAPRW